MTDQIIDRNTTRDSTDKDIIEDKTSVFSSDNTDADRPYHQLPEHLRVPVAEAHYPPTLLKIGDAIKSTTMKIITPFIKLLRFLQRRTNLTFWIITGMVVGILIGRFSPAGGVAIQPLGTAFIRMIKIIVVPLVFSVLVIGIAGHGDDIKKVGFLAIKSFIYFEVVTTIAMALGLIMANIVKPGQGVTLPVGKDTSAVDTLASTSSKSITWDQELFLIIPTNFFVAAHDNQVIAIVFCAVMFACAMLGTDKKSKHVMLDICHSLSQIMFKFVGLIMNYAPIGIGAALAATVGSNGIGVLATLGKLIGTLYASLVIFVLIIVLPIMFIFKIPILPFFKAIAQPWLLAFSSASSESALPLAFEKMREFGCTNALTGFVIPFGYSFNLDGASIYLTLAAIFCAQAAGQNLPISTQMSIMGTFMLTSKGLAAVPRAALVVLAGAAAQYGLSSEAVLMVMGVDAILDMGRTSINLLGNCLACCVMARIEGTFRGEEWRDEEEERRYKKWISEQSDSDLALKKDDEEHQISTR